MINIFNKAFQPNKWMELESVRESVLCDEILIYFSFSRYVKC